MAPPQDLAPQRNPVTVPHQIDIKLMSIRWRADHGSAHVPRPQYKKDAHNKHYKLLAGIINLEKFIVNDK